MFAAMSNDTTNKILDQYVSILLEELDNPDTFSVILKGQLHIESYLNTMLESISTNTSDLELDKLMFVRKIKLCSSFGLIHNDSKPTLIKLANLRNKLAHELWHNISDKDITDLENTFKSCPSLNTENITIQMKSRVGKVIFFICLYAYTQSLNLLESRKGIFQFWLKQINYTHHGEDSITLKFFSKLP
ncbi:MAG: hypothetical protein KA797_07265, partial [Chitinophagales bacterium]|nr:hypothetical protein [Chitinophagales bacterium]